MLDVKIVLDAVPDYLFKACGAETQDERDTVAACVRTYARDCITATLLTIEDGPIFKNEAGAYAAAAVAMEREKWESLCRAQGFLYMIEKRAKMK